MNKLNYWMNERTKECMTKKNKQKNCEWKLEKEQKNECNN